MGSKFYNYSSILNSAEVLEKDKYLTPQNNSKNDLRTYTDAEPVKKKKLRSADQLSFTSFEKSLNVSSPPKLKDNF